MRRLRKWLVRMLPILVPVAIIGYLLGGSVSGPASSSSSADSFERTLAPINTVVLEYPAYFGWRPSSGSHSIPGLPLSNAFLLTPSGQPANVGLVAGQPSGEGSASSLSPLPPQLLDHVPQLSLRGEVVSLLDTQAYRYGQPSTARVTMRLTIYAVPYTAGATTVIACYTPASRGYARFMQTCKQIAAQLTLKGGAQSQVILNPDSGYAEEIGAVLSRIEKLRRALRPGMQADADHVTLSGLARRLANGLSQATRSLTALQPPNAAQAAHTSLSNALSRAQAAYLELSDAAEAANAGRYSSARARVYGAEAGINSALRGLAMIGYA
jgi:hypothetical protein